MEIVSSASPGRLQASTPAHRHGGARQQRTPASGPTHRRHHHDHHRRPPTPPSTTASTSRPCSAPASTDRAPPAAQFSLRATNEWVNGTHSRTTVDGFFGLGAEQSHRQPYSRRHRPPRALRRGRQRPDPARDGADRPGRLPDRRCRVGGAEPGHPAAFGQGDRHGQHRHRRHPRHRPRRAQRLQRHHRPLRDRRRRHDARRSRPSSPSRRSARPSTTSSPTRPPSSSRSPDPSGRAEE